MEGQIEVSRKVFNRVEFDDFASRKPIGNESCSQYKCACSKEKLGNGLLSLFPFINTIKAYKIKEYLLRDIIAGITVGMIHIPQGMGYAILTNLSPVYGLYTSFFPVIIYFFFGSCKHVSVGTMAIISLVVGSVVEAEGQKFLQERANSNISMINMTVRNNISVVGDELAYEFEVYKASIASAMALVSGAIMVLLGLLRLGSVTALMAQPFISGFTSGAAFHITTSQIKSMLGIRVKVFSGILKLPYTWVEICKQLPTAHVPTLVITIISMVILIFFKEFINERFKKKLPMPIPVEVIVLLVSTILSHFLNFSDTFDINIIGPIPRGFPTPFIPPIEKAPNFITDAVITALLSLTITISMADIMSRNEKTSVDSNQEFIAGGLCYGLSSFFYCFMGAAAPPRCFLLAGSGSKTTVANLFTALLLILVLLAIGPLFMSLPKPALASIIVVSIFPLFKQFGMLPHLWRISKVDLSIWIITWIATILFNMDLALIIGIAWSIVTLAMMSMNGTGYLLGQAKHKDLFAAVDKYAFPSPPDGICLYRFESDLVFASVKHFKEQLFKATVNPQTFDVTEVATLPKAIDAKKAQNEQVPDCSKPQFNTIHTIILDCSPFSRVDLMGLNTLMQISADYKNANITFALANCSQALLQKLELDHQISAEGREDRVIVYPTIQDAIAASASSDQTGMLHEDENICIYPPTDNTANYSISNDKLVEAVTTL